MFKDIKDLDEMQTALDAYLPVMNTSCVCGALSQLAKIELPEGGDWGSSSPQLNAGCPLQQRQELAARLSAALCSPWGGRKAPPPVNRLQHWQLANVLWAWAKLQHWPQEHFMQLMDAFVSASSTSPDTRPQALANAAWALGTSWKAWQQGEPQSWHPSRSLVESLMIRMTTWCLPLLRVSNAQDVSTLLLASAYAEAPLPAGPWVCTWLISNTARLWLSVCVCVGGSGHEL